MDNNAGSDGVDRPADNSEGPEEDLINASSDEDVKVIGTRATNRLAEVPQWISNGAESTCEVRITIYLCLRFHRAHS